VSEAVYYLLNECLLLSIRPIAQSPAESHNRSMTEKEIVLETIRALPDDCSLEEIAERSEFMATVQKGLDQLDSGEGIPHDEVKRQLASWLTS
jgi:predicted transcriptional regulator